MILVIDALAARSSKRLNPPYRSRMPGSIPSGCGESQKRDHERDDGNPGDRDVPTVVDAATIVNDTMENFIAALETSENLKA